MSFFRRLFGTKADKATSEDNKIAPEGTTAEVTDTLSTDTDKAQLETIEFADNSQTDEIIAETYDEQLSFSKDTEAHNDLNALPLTESVTEVSIPHPAEGVTRPLDDDPFNIYQHADGHMAFAHSSDQGMQRTNNQDSVYRFFASSHSVDNVPDIGLFMVADGMGGHNHGEQASSTTIQMVATTIIKSFYFPMLNNKDDNSEPFTISEILIQAVKDANRRVMHTIPDGGTTLTAVLTIGDVAHIAHVGDSRAYLINNDKIEQLTRDHSLAQRLIELNQLSVEDRSEYQHRNVLYRAIGHNDDLEVDTIIKRLPQSSYLLICSDGLWGEIGEDDMIQTITTASSLQEACDTMVALANRNGGHDNITVMLLKTPSK